MKVLDVRLVTGTPDPEKIILYCARVSNPKNQNSGNTKLIQYLIEHKHWSPFEFANFIFEIKTSRAIAEQILRHRSMSFQELSTRYAKVDTYEVYPARLQSETNRQNSLETDDVELQQWFLSAQHEVNAISHRYYKSALDRGIAREQARFLLTLATSTTLYVNATLRSYIHYIAVRDEEHAQKEHQEIAHAIKNILIDVVPNTAHALDWVQNE